MQLSEQELVRREKLNKLRDLGINPYPANLFPVNQTSKQIKEFFEESKKVVGG
jgi:lysyl-tRNA synthetase class 2